MGALCYIYGSSGAYYVPSAVKYVTYLGVGGGGGGARPAVPPNFGRSPTAGGATTGPGSLYAGGGGPGQVYYGGYGGYGNYSYGQGGYYNSSGSGDARARSGYGPYGSGGAGQWRSPSQSYGGGGGGASQCTLYRGSSGAIPGQYVSWNVGSGGEQGGTGSCRIGQPGAIYISVCTYDRPSVSISANPSAIIRGQTSTITWSTSGDTDSEILTSTEQNYGQVARSGDFVTQPNSTSTYTYTASNPAYTATASVILTVYIPPVVTLLVDAPNKTIIQGETTTLRWNVTGDASTLTITPGIGSALLNGNTPISPTVTTTYTATASGLGGTGSAEITVTVLPPPSIDVAGPLLVYYNESPLTISIDATNVEEGIDYVLTKYYNDGIPSVTQPAVRILNSTGATIHIIWYIPVEYDNFGPRKIGISFVANGYGNLTASDSIEIQVSIDETPDYIDLPETEDKFRGEEPVVTPDVDVVSQQIVVSDIDIPVEIKSDYPIQVEFDGGEIWVDVREL